MKQIIFGQLDNKFFLKHQRILLFVANCWFLKWIIGTNRLPKALKGKRINRILPASVSFKTGKLETKTIYRKGFRPKKILVEEWTMNAFSRPRFAESLSYKLYPFWKLCHYWDMLFANNFNPAWNLGFDSANYISTGGDGRIYNYDISGWANCRDATTGNGVECPVSEAARVSISAYLDAGNYTVVRSFYPIDTSGLPDGATISAASLFIRGSNIYFDNADTTSIKIVQTSQASTSGLSTSDFDALTFTAGGSLNFASWNQSGFNEIALDTTGLGWINKTGVTKLGAVDNRDFSNSAPTGMNRVASFYSGYTGTDYDPYLSVTYSTLITKVLTETVKTIGTTVKQTQKTLTQLFKVIVPTNAPFVLVSRTITQTIKVLANKISQLNRTLSERFIASASYQKVLTAYKTFTERIIANGVFSKIQTLYRTLTETIKLSGTFARIMTLYRTFVETIKTSGVFTSVATLYKTLSETIITSEIVVDIKRTFVETFNEVIKLSGNISFATTKVLMEMIKIAGSFITNTSITFTERIIASDTYNRIKDVFRTFAETISVIGSKITDIGRTFNQSIKTNDLTIGTQKTKTFVENIIVLEQRIFNQAKLFSEIVKIGAQKLTHRAFIFTQRFIVGTVFSKLPTKVLLQRVKAGDQPEFNKIQYKILTDAIKVVSGFTRSLNRTFFEIINIVGTVTSRITRIFTETISIATNFVALFGHVLWERLTVVGSIGSWVIGKTIVQVINVIDSVGKASAWLMSEIIKVSGNAIVIANKILTETIKVITSIRFFIGRTITHVIRVDNIRIFRHIFYTVKTESFKVVDSILKQSGKIFTQTLNVIDAIGNWSVAKLFIERIRVIDNYVKAWTLSRVYQESIKVASTLYHQIARIFTENVKIVGTFIAGTPAKVFYETIKVAQVITKSLPKVFEETIKVVAIGLNQAGKIFGEAINVVGTFILGTISKLFIERVKIVQNFITAGTFYKVFAETVKVVGNGFNRAGKIFTETVIASGTFVLGTISKMLVETIKVVQKFNVSMSRVFIQTINVVAGLTNRWGRIFGELIKIISPTITKLTGRIFNERVIAGFNKIKLVLNGIQVGLWKRVARITNGVWKKISRNDTL